MSEGSTAQARTRRAAVTTHVRRYPWWYGVGAVWVLAMVVLPVVQADPLDVFSSDPPAATSGPGAAGTTTAAGVGPGLDAATAAPLGGSTVTTAEPLDTAPTVAAAAGSEQALELVPPEVLDLIFDALPALQVPALPPEFAALANAIAPVATYGCSGLGLASVVVAVVAQSAQGVPIERVLPYLAPVVTACAAFPIPPVRTVCEADKPFIVDLGGLASGPPILGLGIDQIDAVETLLSATFGQSLPRVAPQLRAQLGCKQVTEL